MSYARRSLVVMSLTLLLLVGGSCGSAEITAPLQVPQLGRLVLQPSMLDFGYSASELIMTVVNEGEGPLEWSIQSPSWVSTSTTSGSLPAHSQMEVRVTLSRGPLTPGDHNLSLQVFSNGGSQSMPTRVRVLPARPQVAPSTVNVRDFGARGDGQHDDTVAFDAALGALGSSGGVLYVPAGTYILTPKSGRPYRALDLSRRTNITVSGDGFESSTIRMASGIHNRGDTHLVFLMESSWITIQHLTLDGNRQEAFFTDEQNHCAEVWSSVEVRFANVRFQNCRGDGIRLLGVPETGDPWTELVTIEQSLFRDNGRSGVAVQRGVRNLHILNNTFERISDQSIDMEPSGAGSPTDVVIADNVIRHSTQTYAVAIGGIGGMDLAQRLRLVNNRVEDGAVIVYKANDVIIEGNTILGHPFNPPLRITHTVMHLQIIDNQIHGYAGGDEGIVQIVALNGGYPSEVALRGNQIHASEGNSGIIVRDALGGIAIFGNEVQGAGGADGIHIESVAPQGSTRDGFSIVANKISNFNRGIQVSTRNDLFSSVIIESNLIDHPLPVSGETVGILFVNTGSYESFGIVRDNEFGMGIITPIAIR